MNNEELNLVEILKDVPEGTKLYSPIFGDVIFGEINKTDRHCIWCYVKDHLVNFSSKGLYYSQYDGECMLFPSKDNRDWSTFKYVPRHEFKPYDKVLVRDGDLDKWEADIFSHYDEGEDYPYKCVGSSYRHCIHYEGNESIAFTNDMPKGGEK